MSVYGRVGNNYLRIKDVVDMKPISYAQNVI